MKVPLELLKRGKHLETKSLQDSLYSVCVNLNKWKCNFVRPGDEMKHYEFWKEARLKWHLSLG
jgi:glycyl-tRNA synthetase